MSFERIEHQGAAVRLIRTAVASGRLAHALLFVGPAGVGKGLAARETAKLLFCASPRGSGADGLDPCDECPACKRVDHGTHPDFYWFEKEPERYDFRIHLVARGTHREESPEVTVTESVALTPMEAPRTVTVLDDAERLNDAAANALLKSLEEPSPHAVLILLCADASRLPGTILSRCQWVRFRPLPEAFVAENLAALLPDEVPEAERTLAARFSGGSMEEARLLAESGLAGLKRQLIDGLARMDEAAAIDLAEAVREWAGDRAKAEKVKRGNPRETALRRHAGRTALAVASSAFRDAAVVAAGAEDRVGLTHADQSEAIAALAAWPEGAAAQAVALLADAEAQIARYVHPELAAENAFLQVSRLRHERVSG